MEYLKTNDEIINSIHTARQEDYWELYLPEFRNQIQDYTDAFEWDKAKGACSELTDIHNKFPKKWWELTSMYWVSIVELRKDIKQLYDLEINVYDNE